MCCHAAGGLLQNDKKRSVLFLEPGVFCFLLFVVVLLSAQRNLGAVRILDHGMIQRAAQRSAVCLEIFFAQQRLLLLFRFQAYFLQQI